MIAPGPSIRLLPKIDDANRFFWSSGEDGRLRFLRCGRCGKYAHPPVPRCPYCLEGSVHDGSLAPEPVSGRGVLHSFTVNHQQWIPGSDTYIVGLVEIDEQDDVRLMTNIVDAATDDARVGMEVEVTFEHREDVWLPLFRPVASVDASGSRVPGGPTGTAPFMGQFSSAGQLSAAGRRRFSGEPLERRAVISGIGQSAIGRRLGRSDLDLTLEACLAAIEDAGLRREDIDGLSTYPGMGFGPAGFGGPPSPDVQDALRLSLNWHDGGGEGPGQIRAVFSACLAVAAGLAGHVLVYRTVTESTAQKGGGRAGIGAGSLSADGAGDGSTGSGGGGSGGGGSGGPAGGGSRIPRFSGFLQWSLPFGAMSAANWIALVAQRRFHEFGLTREQLAQIALNGRRNAASNPKAIYRDPLSLEDYLAARTISSPLCLYDCDAPCDGSTAVVVSHRDFAPDAPGGALYVNSIGTALRGRPSWDQFDDMTTMAARDAAASMWERTDLSPSDVDVAELYDGFSVLTMVWLEELGFCKKGESGEFVAGGRRISLRGELPLNTSGGQLSGGRLHGFGLLHEACVQLRGAGGQRQVPGDPQVAAVANGGGPIAGAMLLTKGPA